MSWSFVGSNEYGPSGVASVTLTLPAGVQGGDLIIVSCATYQSGTASVTCAALVTQYDQACADNTSAHWGYVATRTAAGAAGSATTDTTFTLTFGGGTSSWGVATIYVLRSTVGIGTIANTALYTNASYKTSPLTSPALTVANSGDATVYGYGGVTSAASETFSAFGDTSLSNLEYWNSTPANGCLAGIGWGTGVSSPAAATFTNSGATGLDQFNWGLDVTEASGGGGGYTGTNGLLATQAIPGSAMPGNAVPGQVSVTSDVSSSDSGTGSDSGSVPLPPGQLATSTSAKALQRSSADKCAYLFDGSMIAGYWDGTDGEIIHVTSPLTSPSVTSLITTAEDAISIWSDNSSGTSSDVWVASSYDDASGSGPGLHVRHGSYNGSTFAWDAATSVSGPTTADTISCSVTWNGTYLIVFWWDGTSGSDVLRMSYTSVKAGTSGWTEVTTFAGGSWSTIVQVSVRHSIKLGATVVVFGGNSQMYYAALPDSAATPALANWTGPTNFWQFADNYANFGGPQLVIDESTGDIHVARAMTTGGGPTTSGICYWHGTYSAGTVTWGGVVQLVADGGASTPADIGLAVTSTSVVYVLYTTATAAGNLNYVTVTTPFTGGGTPATIVAGSGSSNPRWPHAPAVSAAMGGLSTALPVMWTDTDASPYPVWLNTSVTLSSTASVSSSDTGTGADTQGAIRLAGSDTGTGAEAQGTALSSQDSGTGAEAQGLQALGSSADTGSGADAQGSIPLAGQDAGSGAEAQSVLARLASTDAGSGAEAQGLALASQESGTGADTGTANAAVTSGDTGTGAEAQGLGTASADTGAGADAQSVFVTVPVASADTATGADAGLVPGVLSSDTGSGTDTQGVALLSADTGSGTDTQGVAPVVPVASGDAGTGTEAQGVSLAGSDTGGGLEAQSLLAAVADTETGHGLEAGAVGATLVSSADAGQGSESQQAGGLQSADSGSGAEAQQVTAFLASPDAGQGSELYGVGLVEGSSADAGNGLEAQQVTAHIADYDTGAGTEAQSYTPSTTQYVYDTDSGRGQEGDTEGYASADAAAGTEAQGVPFVLVSDADAATGTDTGTLVIAVQAVQDLDSGTGTEGWSTAAAKEDTDTGSGADAQALLYAPQDADAGTAAEQSIYSLEVYPYPPPWLYNSPGGGYRLVFRPGTAQERVVQEFTGRQHEVFADARRLLEKIQYADDLLTVTDVDGATATDGSAPTATIEQYPVITAVELGVFPGARLVMLASAGTRMVSDADAGSAAEAVSVG